jgi:hypothetical protein
MIRIPHSAQYERAREKRFPISSNHGPRDPEPILPSPRSTYHRERNHQGLENRLIQLPVAATADHGPIHCSARLGGTLNLYYREAA